MTANQLDALLKKTGKGLLIDYGIHTPPPDRRAMLDRDNTSPLMRLTDLIGLWQF